MEDGREGVRKGVERREGGSEEGWNLEGGRKGDREGRGR